MIEIFRRHSQLWKQYRFSLSVGLGVLLFACSLVANYFAGTFATREVSNTVTDIILDNIPVFNVSFIFIQGFALMVVGILTVLFYQPKTIPFAIKAFALFIVVRSFSIILTHIAPPISHSVIYSTNDIVQHLTFDGDLFFSGHAGIPFLAALINWQTPKLRALFLATSIFFGIAVLMGHLHYSIDVFAAYFVTYGVFKIAQKLFVADYHLSAAPLVKVV